MGEDGDAEGGGGLGPTHRARRRRPSRARTGAARPGRGLPHRPPPPTPPPPPPPSPSPSSQGAAIDASYTGASADHDRADAALQFSGGRCQNIDAAERGAYGGNDMEARTAGGRRSCWSGGGGRSCSSRRSCSGRRTWVDDLVGPTVLVSADVTAWIVLPGAHPACPVVPSLSPFRGDLQHAGWLLRQAGAAASVPRQEAGTGQ